MNFEFADLALEQMKFMFLRLVLNGKSSMTVRTARVTTTENTETSSWDLAVARDNIPGLKITAYYLIFF